MNIILYTTSSPSNKIGKALSALETITGVSLQADTDIVNPMIELSGSHLENWQKTNYIYIADFSRYYFVSSKVMVDQNHLDLYLRCDVLESYKSNIRGTTQFVTRSEKSGSWYVPDASMPYRTSVTHSSQNLSAFKPLPVNNLTNTSPNILVAVADGYYTSDRSTYSSMYPPQYGIRYYVMTPRQLHYLAYYLSGGGTWVSSWLNANASTGVFRISAFPFELPHNSTQTAITIGNATPEMVGTSGTETIPCYELRQSTNYSTWSLYSSYKANVAVSNIPTDFRAAADGVAQQIYLPFSGWHELQSSLFINRPYINIEYRVNVLMGTGTIILYALTDAQSDSTEEDIIANYEFTCCADIPLTISNATEISRNTTNAVISAVLSIGAAAVTKSAMAIGMAAGTGVGNIVKSAATPVSYSTTGALSGQTSNLLPMFPIIYTDKRECPILDSSTAKASYAAEFGICLNEPLKLATGQGKTVCQNFEIDLPGYSTEAEYSELKNLMNSGVIL